MKDLVALDWGTSALRGARMDSTGVVLEQRSFDRGILSVEPGEFPSVFESCFGDWMKSSGSLCLMAGMVGSKQGWREAPYCACPSGFAEIAAKLSWVLPGRVAIVPGLRCERNRIPDVMRGEETQIFGALKLLGLGNAVMVLPGTHSKWVKVEHGRISEFSTFMTGEFYALLRHHSILARTLPASEGEFNSEVFADAVALALRGDSLMQTAFSVRTLALFDRMPTAALPSYLSGLVIGEEIRAQRMSLGGELILIGSNPLTQRYRQALAMIDISSVCLGEEATWAGLWAIAEPLLANGNTP